MNYLRIRDSKDSTCRESRGATPTFRSTQNLIRWTINWRPDVKVNFRVLGLFACGFALIAALSYGGLQAFQYLNQPITSFKLQSELKYINEKEVLNSIEHFGPQGFLSVDLDALKEELKAWPFIDSVVVRKQWPNELLLKITEHQPMARWYDKQLLLSHGALVALSSIDEYKMLPILTGPEGSEKEVMSHFLKLSNELKNLGLNIQQLNLLPRGAWQFTLDQGTVVRLGKDNVDDKMQRFISLCVSTLKEELAKVISIDLRYSNGAAVRWNETTQKAS